MNARILLVALVLTATLSAGCGWRRGCSRCSSKIEVLPVAPTYYTPPPSCATPHCP
jgi:hypothetical protein